MTQPIVVKVIRYACPFCSRSRAKKTATEAHIGRCWSNPANRTCKTCVHFSEGSGGGSEGWCIEGRPCSCNDYPASCEAEVDLPEWDHLPVVGCPLWATAEAGEGR